MLEGCGGHGIVERRGHQTSEGKAAGSNPPSPDSWSVHVLGYRPQR